MQKNEVELGILRPGSSRASRLQLESWRTPDRESSKAKWDKPRTRRLHSANSAATRRARATQATWLVR